MRNTAEKAENKADRTCFKSNFLTWGWPGGDCELRRIPAQPRQITVSTMYYSTIIFSNIYLEELPEKDEAAWLEKSGASGDR